MSFIKGIGIFLILCGSLSSIVDSARILILIPISTRSEVHFFYPIIKQLEISSPEHDITVVTSRQLDLNKRVRQLTPLKTEDNYKAFQNIQFASNSYWDYIFIDPTQCLPNINSLFENKEFQEKVLNEKYDLVITHTLWGELFYGYIHKIGAPFIFLQSWAAPNYLLKYTGMYIPQSIIPIPVVEFTDKMSFRKRVVNYVIDWAQYYFYEYHFLPIMESVYKKHMGNNLPSVKEVQRNLSLVLMNTHFLSTYHRPLMPDVVEVGGVHCVDPKPLPKDLEAVASAKNNPDGFILVSFGSFIRGSSMTNEDRLKLVKVFSKLKQTVIWKWESEEMEDLPKNVILKDWLPQQDLLGHPNIRLFITHGGLLSTQQTIYHGVPVISFAICMDQMTNGRHLQELVMGKMMDFQTYSEAELTHNINEMLTNSSYQTTASRLSSVYKETINSPAERAVFWIKHVLKYGGATHLGSSARELNWIQFHSVDVILFLAAILFVAVMTTLSLLRTILRCILPRNVTSKVKEN